MFVVMSRFCIWTLRLSSTLSSEFMSRVFLGYVSIWTTSPPFLTNEIEKASLVGISMIVHHAAPLFGVKFNISVPLYIEPGLYYPWGCEKGPKKYLTSWYFLGVWVPSSNIRQMFFTQLFSRAIKHLFTSVNVDSSRETARNSMEYNQVWKKNGFL